MHMGAATICSLL